ncbi:MAG: ORF6N domain-containing protein [Crocinitomicaceae bacterium]|nr:ORF6N domain-containing protein [Flavobacteriales bacterium]NQZ37451.1 ORF6N domain-containing protein [Crocinitomicaceae bacterium]
MEIEHIQQAVHIIREQKVMLDSDLATLYGVETKVLNLAVKRNLNRFPEDFMFTLSEIEWSNLRLQSETSSDHGGRRYLPKVFTEHGIAMLSGVLKSDRAVSVNISIMRMFVQMRKFASNYSELEERISQLEERSVNVHLAISELMRPIERDTNRLGY